MRNAREKKSHRGAGQLGQLLQALQVVLPAELHDLHRHRVCTRRSRAQETETIYEPREAATVHRKHSMVQTGARLLFALAADGSCAGARTKLLGAHQEGYLPQLRLLGALG